MHLSCYLLVFEAEKAIVWKSFLLRWKLLTSTHTVGLNPWLQWLWGLERCLAVCITVSAGFHMLFSEHTHTSCPT